MKSIEPHELKDFKIGNAQSFRGLTGCTVILCENGAVTGVDVRGGAPGTRETDLLKPENTIERVHATFLSGGSAYGLEVGAGIMAYLEEKRIGYDTTMAKVPIVPGAILFDFMIGDAHVRPDKNMGYHACENAYGNRLSFGNIGAGTGATVGKLLGTDYMMKTGVGFAGYQIGDFYIAAVVAVNAFGDIMEPASNQVLAGLYDQKNQKFLNTENKILHSILKPSQLENTTIGTIMTNASLTKAQAKKIASIGQDGIARIVRPSHTFLDGDTIFTMSSGNIKIDINVLAVLAPKVVEEAIIDGVKKAKSEAGIPGYL
ncbi:P1 family peptidase [Gracilibacillus sp. YIM 98692]|uniref:P1 family peptidase n=1 Tax=Gracilibacillus sp. YIM 98692 TaxID=2663532 RepID=UPI0013D4DCB7|nr:P1 family peptidase [Gracilibacillus sp. YIM 98692]